MALDSRIMPALIGAAMGAILLGAVGHLVGALIGACVVLGAVELNAIRAQVKRLDAQVRQLRVAAGALPLMLIAAVIAVGGSSHPAAEAGWLGWPLAFIGLAVIMYRLEGVAGGVVANALNSVAIWLLCLLCSWELEFQIGRAIHASDVWATTAWAWLPLLFLWRLPQLVARVPWPFAKNRDAYMFVAGMGIAVFLYVWSAVANLHSQGDFAPLPYCPLLNPLDVTQAVVLWILWRYWRFYGALEACGFPRIDPQVPIPALTALTFLWLNAILLRTLHQWFEVAYGWDQLLTSTLVQTSLSIFWAILAFIIMSAAARRHRRVVWLVGATLLGVVIAKLFLVDLSHVGSIERIVSFVGVGLLMLVIGYVSPLPPERVVSVSETTRA